MEFGNKFIVGLSGTRDILILNPPDGPISPEDALLLAAWLVSVSEAASQYTFQYVLEEVQA